MTESKSVLVAHFQSRREADLAMRWIATELGAVGHIEGYAYKRTSKPYRAVVLSVQKSPIRLSWWAVIATEQSA